MKGERLWPHTSYSLATRITSTQLMAAISGGLWSLLFGSAVIMVLYLFTRLNVSKTTRWGDKIMTKYIAGINYTALRRPYHNGQQTHGPIMLLRFGTFDALVWQRNNGYPRRITGPKGYLP